MLTEEEILTRVISGLNAEAVSLGYVDANSVPLYYFYGEISTYSDYDWIKSLSSVVNGQTKYTNVIPVALIRNNSTTYAGEKIARRFDEYSLYFYIKPGQREDIVALIEAYMLNENSVSGNNLETVGTTTILKSLTNFLIGNEQLNGAPDGESRIQGSLDFTYDMFPATLVSSKSWVLTFGGIEVPYLSWRFEKSNIIIANQSTSTAGTTIDKVNKLHDISMTCELYLDTSNTEVMKLLGDITNDRLVGRAIDVRLSHDGTGIFTRSMIFTGGKTTDTPPQISSILVTLAPAYSHISMSIGIYGNEDDNGDQIYETIPVSHLKFGSVASLHTAMRQGDNASRSQKVGDAKALDVSFVVLTGSSPVLDSLIAETLSHVYTVVYSIRLSYYGATYTYKMVLDTSYVEVSDPAYDILPFSFVEAE